jgi:hypothetical protein
VPYALEELEEPLADPSCNAAEVSGSMSCSLSAGGKRNERMKLQNLIAPRLELKLGDLGDCDQRANSQPCC